MSAKVPRIRYTCPICSNVFLDRAKRRRVYCSRPCMYEARRLTGKRVRLACEYCGAQFTALDGSGWNTHNQQRFCSQSCKGKGIAQERHLHIREKTTFICEHCKKPFVKMARADREYHFCCLQCFWAERRGEKHHNWQGGTDRYYGPNWDEQRLKTLSRDNYMCQICGISKEGMNVHHIVKRSEFGQNWKTMNDLSNLLTLCSSCHGRVHIDNLPTPALS